MVLHAPLWDFSQHKFSQNHGNVASDVRLFMPETMTLTLALAKSGRKRQML
jgi:hypothetical protein